MKRQWRWQTVPIHSKPNETLFQQGSHQKWQLYVSGTSNKSIAGTIFGGSGGTTNLVYVVIALHSPTVHSCCLQQASAWLGGSHLLAFSSQVLLHSKKPFSPKNHVSLANSRLSFHGMNAYWWVVHKCIRQYAMIFGMAFNLQCFQHTLVKHLEFLSTEQL